MSDIVDIIHNLSYQITGQSSIQAIQRQFDANVQSIGRNVASLARLQQQLNAATDPARQARLQQAIQNRTRAINEQGQAITNAIQNDRQFQRTLQQEIGIINEMNGRLRSLRESRERATSSAEIRRYTDQIRDVERAQNRLQGGSIFNRAGASLLQGVGIGSGIALFQQGIGAVADLMSDASRLAAEVEGIRPAFDRLNDPNLLNNLRTATKGTISDLELMKSAVQFKNFGLPVERMADAFRFARIRAKETGQDVDYLVQSIVMGIGRQSPLILDNLGINIKRVREEFARTGDFAQAAFNIITEEANKSGKDVDTFTERMGKLNATFENAKVPVGNFFNFIKDSFVAAATDVINFQEYAGSASEAVVKAYDERKKQAELAPRVQKAADDQFLRVYKGFIDEYQKADADGRKKIIDQATKMHERINEAARFAYKEGTDDLRVNLEAEISAFQRFTSLFRNIKIDPKKLNRENVRGYTREELLQAQESNDFRRNALTGNDAAAIASINATDKLIKDQLDKINGQVAKAPAIRAPRVAKVDFDKLREGIKKGYFKLVKDVNSDIRSADEFLINPSKDGDIIFGELSKFINDPDTPANRAEVARLQRAEDESKFRRENNDDSESFKIFEDYKNAAVDAYQTIQSVALSVIDTIYNNQISALDREIQYRQYAVTQATTLAERGNTELLKYETNRLEEAQRKREEVTARQMQANSLMQASNSALALTEALLVVTNAGKTGDPYSTAVRIAAAAAALGAAFGVVFSLVNAANAQAGGFYKGGYTGDGQKMETAGTVHKGEFVFNKETTSKHRELFESIHKGENPVLAMPKYPIYMPNIPQSLNQKNEIVSMKKELREIKDVLLNQRDDINVKQSMDAYGLTQSVERISRIDKKKYK